MNTLETSARPSPKETVKAFYEAFDQGALRRFGGIGGLFEARVFGATVLDWPGFLAFSEAFRAGFPDGKHVFDFVIAEGDSVATIGRYHGRHTRPFMGVARALSGPRPDCPHRSPSRRAGPTYLYGRLGSRGRVRDEAPSRQRELRWTGGPPPRDFGTALVSSAEDASPPS